MGGGTSSASRISCSACGPSPRGRGHPCGGRVVAGVGGAIPAWAGAPSPDAGCQLWPWGHPRVGGGTLTQVQPRLAQPGPSPRGRGHRIGARWSLPRCGAIPAWAGAPVRDSRGRARRRGHPRVGGGTVVGAAPLEDALGPSPRGRGHPEEGKEVRSSMGAIPAWAGAPCLLSRCSALFRGHPRVGGGTSPPKTGSRAI